MTQNGINIMRWPHIFVLHDIGEVAITIITIALPRQSSTYYFSLYWDAGNKLQLVFCSGLLAKIWKVSYNVRISFKSFLKIGALTWKLQPFYLSNSDLLLIMRIKMYFCQTLGYLIYHWVSSYIQSGSLGVESYLTYRISNQLD